MRKLPDYLMGALTGAVIVLAVIMVGAAAGIKTADWMSFYGTLLGSMVTIIGAVAVFQLQTDAADRRHLRTMRSLLSELGTAGDAMNAPDAALDPARHVESARISYAASLNIADELSSNGPQIARVAVQLGESNVRAQLTRLRQTIDAGGGIAAADLQARGGEIRQLADQLTGQLNNGL